MIVFLHVPKTAGITLRRDVLKRQYGEDATFSSGWHQRTRTDGVRSVGVYSDEVGAIGLFQGMRHSDSVWYPDSVPEAAAGFLALPEEKRARIRLYWAKHVEYGVHEHLPVPAEYVTLLRDPVERVLSHYWFAREKRVLPEGMDLPEHVRELVEPNLQTRLLAGPSDPKAPPPPAELLERARRNLRACRVVGLSERFDESVLMMRKAFGWRMPLYVRRNVGRHRPPRSEVPAEALARIAEENSLDAVLYAEAQEVFEEQVRSYGPRALERDLARFRALNALWQRGSSWGDAVSVGAQRMRAALDAQAGRAAAAVGRSGALRRLLPDRLAPRVEAVVDGTTLFFDLRMGRRTVGSYDPRVGRWEIRTPYRLFVDEASLPGAGPGARGARGA